MSAFSAAAQDEDGDIISALRARVADLEAQLYAVGAGGVGSTVARQDHSEQHLDMVPEGWKLVPVEPTTKMIDAARSQSSFPAGVYRAMLAAAPQPPLVEQPQGTWHETAIPDKLASQAIDALASYCNTGEIEGADDLLASLLYSIEQPQSVTDCHQSQPKGEQEPVAWQYRMRPDWGSKKDCWGPWQDCTKEQAAMYQRVPLLHDWAYESRQLYTRPQPPRQPLTDAQINDHRLALPFDGEDMPDPWDFKQGVKAAERAHGIGGDA